MDPKVLDVRTIRTNFLRLAILKVRTLVAKQELEEAQEAGDELKNYFEWMKDDMVPCVGEALYEQILVLQEAVFNMVREKRIGRTESKPILVLR